MVRTQPGREPRRSIDDNMHNGGKLYGDSLADRIGLVRYPQLLFLLNRLLIYDARTGSKCFSPETHPTIPPPSRTSNLIASTGNQSTNMLPSLAQTIQT